MSIVVCSKCKMRVLPKSDGMSPSCEYGLAIPNYEKEPNASHATEKEGYVQSEKEARQQLVELVDTRIRDWMAGGFAAKGVSD